MKYRIKSIYKKHASARFFVITAGCFVILSIIELCITDAHGIFLLLQSLCMAISLICLTTVFCKELSGTKLGFTIATVGWSIGMLIIFSRSPFIFLVISMLMAFFGWVNIMFNVMAEFKNKYIISRKENDKSREKNRE